MTKTTTITLVIDAPDEDGDWRVRAYENMPVEDPWQATRDFPEDYMDWTYETRNGDTLLGFLEWREHRNSWNSNQHPDESHEFLWDDYDQDLGAALPGARDMIPWIEKEGQS